MLPLLCHKTSPSALRQFGLGRLTEQPFPIHSLLAAQS